MKAKFRRVCQGKKRYATEAEAREMALFWKRFVYQCPGCGRWHLTSTEPRNP